MTFLTSIIRIDAEAHERTEANLYRFENRAVFTSLNNPRQVISHLLVFFFTDIRLDWEAYNILPQDPQLLDMLVFIGQPLPVFKDGQEVVPGVKEEDRYQREEEKPFIQVKLREHDGVCANRPFDVTPSQQVRESWEFHGLCFVLLL